MDKITAATSSMALHVCDKCKKTFTNEKKLRCHVNCSHPHLVCPYCNYGPKRFKNLVRRHILSRHKGEEIYYVNYFDGCRED